MTIATVTTTLYALDDIADRFGMSEWTSRGYNPGMYGDRCAALTVDIVDVPAASLVLAAAFLGFEPGDTLEVDRDLIDALRYVRTDGMGREVVVYIEQLGLSDDDESDDVDDDE